MAIQGPQLLGDCPLCSEITAVNASVVVEYKTEEDGEKVWAGCPNCNDIVHPE